MADPRLLASPGTELSDLAALSRGGARAQVPTAKIPVGLFAHALRFTDAALVYLSGVAIYLLHPLPEPESAWGDGAWAAYQLAMVLATVAASNLFALAECYDGRQLTAGRMAPFRLLAVWGVVWFVMLTTAVMFKTAQDYSRVWFVGWGLTVSIGLVLSRLGAWILIQHWIAAGRLTINVAVIGAGRIVGDLAHLIGTSDGRLYQIVGIFDDAAGEHAGIPGLADLEALIRGGRVETVVIAVPWIEEGRILGLLARLRAFPVDIRLAPTQLGFPFGRARYSTLSGVTMLDVFSAPLSGWKRLVKRLEDLLLGSVLLIVFLPLMLIISVAVRWDSPGPILFRQKRYGYNNALIEVFKFRSMRHECTDHNAERLVRPEDPRVTRLGGWLRRSSLDELPQLLNVIRGDMSLVGPRPHALRAKAADRLYEDVVEEYAARHRVKPGITGWAQVNGWRGVTDTEDKIRRRIEYDLDYIERWSVLFDLKILAMTVVALIRPTNAH